MEKLKSNSNFEKITLDAYAMATGIGRKATDEELREYLDKGYNVKPIGLDEAFSKYSTFSKKDKKPNLYSPTS